jgi:hypothetical protein
MTTWLLIQRDGKVYKEDVRGVYDVSQILSLEYIIVADIVSRAQSSGASVRRE